MQSKIHPFIVLAPAVVLLAAFASSDTKADAVTR